MTSRCVCVCASTRSASTPTLLQPVFVVRECEGSNGDDDDDDDDDGNDDDGVNGTRNGAAALLAAMPSTPTKPLTPKRGSIDSSSSMSSSASSSSTIKPVLARPLDYELVWSTKRIVFGTASKVALSRNLSRVAA